MGSKNRIADKILPIILADRTSDQWYVEPFVGGANMIDKVQGLRLGADIHAPLISAIRMIRDCPEGLPRNNTQFTENHYQQIKKNPDAQLYGYVGFTITFGAKWWGGRRRDKEGRDYVKEAYRNAVKQSPRLQGIVLQVTSYDELKIPPNSIIYCDPPYQGTTKYKHVFDSEKLFNWCLEQASQGHTVFVSEYNAPEAFECIWQAEIQASLTVTGSKKATEKLFKVKGE